MTYVRKQSILKAVATIHLSKNEKNNNLPLNDGSVFVPGDVARPNDVPVFHEFRQSRHHLGLVLALEGMQDSLVAGLIDGRDVGRQEDDGDLRVIVPDDVARVGIPHEGNLPPGLSFDEGNEDLVKQPLEDR